MNKCPECGGSLVGRSDRKFCCDDCRNSYHNKKNRIENGELRRVNRILKSNYIILKELSTKRSITKSGRIRCNIATLLSRGFNFKYFTCIELDNGKNPKYLCYNIQYTICKNDCVIIYQIIDNGNN